MDHIWNNTLGCCFAPEEVEFIFEYTKFTQNFKPLFEDERVRIEYNDLRSDVIYNLEQ